MGRKDRYRRSESPGALQDHPGSMDDAPIGVGASAYTAVAPADRGHFSEHGRPTGSDQFRGEDPPQFSGPAGPGVSPGKKSNFPPVPSTLTPSAPHAILEPGRQLFELSHEEVLRTQRRRAKHAGSAYRAPVVQDRAYRAPDSHDATSLAAILRSDKEFLTIVKNAMSKRLRRGKPARHADPAKGGESDSSSTGGEVVPIRRPGSASAGLRAPPRESAALSGRRLRPAKDVVCPPQQVASPVARQGPGDPPVRQTGALAQVGWEQRPFSSDFLPISRHGPGQPLSSAAAVVQPHLHGSAVPLHQPSRTPLPSGPCCSLPVYPTRIRTRRVHCTSSSCTTAPTW